MFAVIFVLLTMTFRSASEATIVMLSVLYAMTGGVILQWLLGYNFSVAVWIGYIALYGVAVETGVVMVIYLHEALDKTDRQRRADPRRHPRGDPRGIGAAPAPEAHDRRGGHPVAPADLLVHGNGLRSDAPDRDSDRRRDDHVDDPRASRHAGDLLPADEGASARGERTDVLLVEDDEELRSATSVLLRDEGFRVAEAGDGARALEYLNRARLPSLVILDLLMPGLDGFQLIARLRNTPKLRELPIVVVSGATKTGFLAGLQNVVAHLSKPFSAQELVACVRKFSASP